MKLGYKAIEIRNPREILSEKAMKDKINAVEMMRSLRDQLQDKYQNNPSIRKKDLEAIRSKYKIKTKDKESL